MILDLLDFLLRRAVLVNIHETSPKLANKLNVHNEPYDYGTIDDGFRVEIYCWLSTSKKTPGVDIVEKLLEICKNQRLKIF